MKEVEKYINENFEIKNFNVVKMPLLPQGVVLTQDHSDDGILVWYDFNKEKIETEYIENYKLKK